jgi:hypothetical protein
MAPKAAVSGLPNPEAPKEKRRWSRIVSADEIRARIRRPWASVPIAVLEDKRLSLASRTILAYLLDLGRRPNWAISVRQVQAALGISQGVWQRHRRELQAVGYYAIARVRDAAGHLGWEHTVTDEPGTIGAFSTDGESIGGKPADIHSTKRHNPTANTVQAAPAPGDRLPPPNAFKTPRAKRVASKKPLSEELSTDPRVLATIGEVVEWLRTTHAAGNKREMRRVVAANLRRRHIEIVRGLIEHILQQATERAANLEQKSREGRSRAADQTSLDT